LIGRYVLDFLKYLLHAAEELVGAVPVVVPEAVPVVAVVPVVVPVVARC
jgi:hypothetical protein